jgi:outer membrane receptor protein involved in Fe transport
VPGGCVDTDETGDDPYPLITNCPVPGYRIGGLGFNEDQKASRLSGLLSVTQRVQALGHHVIKVGGDVEEQGFLDSRYYPGGAAYQELADGTFVIRRFHQPSEDGMEECGFDNDGDDIGDATCRVIGPGEELAADTKTRNFGAYVQDSWSILPNLTLNAGLRWEQQTLYAADDVVGEISPVTSEPIPEEAFKLKNLLAPRAGIVYDPTQEGRSKFFAHYGRFYESIPMDINSRAYGGEVINQTYVLPGFCDPLNAPETCDEDGGFDGSLNYGGHSLVDPEIGAQYLDEVVLGGEYEILADLKLGASYIYRDLGRVIEDVSTDGGNTYVIANPGDVNQAEVDRLREEAMSAGDPAQADFLRRQANFYEGVGVFDAPKRTYNAIQVTAERRFTKSLFLSASYTYSETRGNYPGLFSHETEQLDPNLTSLYDLPELMANRYGNLGSDRPHLVRLDGFYRLLLDPSIGFFTFGAAIRAQSGLPINTLGRHFGYGRGESYILERGTGGRMGLTTRFDTHVAYGRNLSEGTRLEAFVDIFNLFNQQPELVVDDEYTLNNTNPIVGGDEEDLAHSKVQYTGSAITKNPNFGNTTERQPPLSARFGLRLLF